MIRKLIQKYIYILLDHKKHFSEYRKYKPKLILVGSQGLDVDANVIKEAKVLNIKTAVITQSWDRTVCKGYPIIETDNIFVWNNHMKKECIDFFGYQRKKNIRVWQPNLG